MIDLTARKRVRRVRRVVKRKTTISQHEKGHLFEDVVERYFQLLGYRVAKNVRIRGFSGAIHEIDVLIEKNGVKGVVEVKNYSEPIPKEWIMKANGIAKDIGTSEVYVVSSSGFTHDAVKVAEVLGVKLLNLDDMVKEVKKRYEIDAHSFYVKPVIPSWRIKEYASKYVSKLFFIPTEEVGEAEILYLPFYAFSVEHTYVETSGILFKKEIEKKVEFTLLASALNGSLVVIDENSVVLNKLVSVSKDEAELLSMFETSKNGLTLRELEKITGWSKAKLTRVLSKLEENGLIECEEVNDDRGRVVKKYYSVVPTVDELMSSKILIPERLEHGKPDGSVLEPKVLSSHVMSAVSTLYKGMKILDKRLIYLPIYRVKLISTKDESYRYIYLTAHTAEPMIIKNYTG